MAEERPSKKGEIALDRSAITRSQDVERSGEGVPLDNATDEISTSEQERQAPPKLGGGRAYSLGDRIAGRYEVLEQLGSGVMSVVYLTRDEKIHRLVAVKVLSAHGSSPRAMERTRREASASNVLDASRVARVFDVGETSGGELYLVMEYVKGRTARALLRAGRLERSEALRIVREVAITLGQAHRAGLVHRDIKPDNIVVAEDGRVVVLDFGIVKYLVSDGVHFPSRPSR